MAELLALLAAGIFAVLAGSYYVLAQPMHGDRLGRPGAFARRLVMARDGLRETIGAPVAALGILLAGIAAVIAVCWPLGWIAHKLEDAVDKPAFRWNSNHLHDGAFRDINKLLTLMGNRPEVKVVCVVSAVALAILWRRRGWWVPPLVIAVAFGVEKYEQKFLGLVVHRGHPPTTMGTYPSGGVARLVAIYGVILYLIFLTYPNLSRRLRITVWTVFSLAAFVEGYTRIYLLKHWLTDVIGGWVYGSLLLAALIAATSTLAATRESARRVGAPTTSPSDVPYRKLETVPEE